jgi:hypothetical protein
MSVPRFQVGEWIFMKGSGSFCAQIKDVHYTEGQDYEPSYTLWNFGGPWPESRILEDGFSISRLAKERGQ